MEVDARREGDGWTFRSRERRPEQWRALPDPPLVDWLELLDAVSRRIHRGLMRPEESERLKKIILKRFPEADLRGL